MRVLDADQQGADWRDVSRIVLRIDPDTEADRARLAFESHPLACQMDDRARLSSCDAAPDHCDACPLPTLDHRRRSLLG
jgi:hypothetical protein